MTLWMKITRDKYELPVAVADTCVQLGRILGVSTESIYSTMSSAAYRQRKGKNVRCQYVKVEVDDDDI